MADLLTRPFSWLNLLYISLAAVIMLGIVLFFVTYAIYFERKVIGWIQIRYGPNRVGPKGLLQTVADVFKLLIKEDIIPEKADKALFRIGPMLAYLPAFAVIAVIPYSEKIQFADVNVGILYYAALSSITITGILLGGWASNNKYAIMGGMRSVAQMISYEVPLIMSFLGIVIMTGSLNLIDIVEAQKDSTWFIFPQIIGFITFLIAGNAELNRTPFDLPEAENELVAGYFVEYSGFRFAFYYLTEYVYVFAMASLMTVLFLGGWDAPFGLDFIPGIIWFILKFMLLVFYLFWVRATFPRVKTNQLMGFAWKVLIPVALFNVLLTAVLKILNVY
ncbi:NADH-quinone oxidoreductase subunit H [Vulcanibacillus modesticaldus]|uniref:NADH-quinone oxidoreductase subunit H n=2 Tax=Vulcanibacillus modesticaldus TaxID=337097 RepID=A0A1D2YVT5_9BACI|nr:NADH-quinone oxidoreductase subunit NuoH [Vulcanibacillus modesticaldus]OEF99824.1 NADH-quinone oxidoreductase subunit H [Vulcanibacillus modesticaldus]